MTDDQLQKEIDRASKARAVMDSEIVKETLDMIENDVLLAWEQSPPRDKEAREQLWMFYIAARKFRNTLQQVMETGRMAELQLQQKSWKQRLFA